MFHKVSFLYVFLSVLLLILAIFVVDTLYREGSHGSFVSTTPSHCLVSAPSEIGSKTISTDGGMLAYVAYTDNTYLCITQNDGEGDPTLLLSVSSPARLIDLGYSPDGKMLAFVWDSNTDPAVVTDSSVYVMDMTNEEYPYTRVNPDEVEVGLDPVWTSDTTLSFTSASPSPQQEYTIDTTSFTIISVVNIP